jgi:hypothetical protein
VIKDVLALDPVLDVLLTRLNCIFLPRGNTVDSSRLEDYEAVDHWLNTEWVIIEQWIGTQADLGRRLPPPGG